MKQFTIINEKIVEYSYSLPMMIEVFNHNSIKNLMCVTSHYMPIVCHGNLPISKDTVSMASNGVTTYVTLIVTIE